MGQFSINVTGQWSDLYTLTGVSTERPLLIYADGGNIAVALSATEPENLAYGAEAYQGEQLTAGGDGTNRVYVRATTGTAIIRVQDEETGAVRKGSTGKVVDILDRVEIKDIRAIQTVNENSTQFGEDLVASRTPINQLNSSYGFTALRYLKEEINGATVTNGAGTIDLATSTNANAIASLQAAEVGRYSTGFGAQVGNNFIPQSLPAGDAVFTWGAEGESQLNGVWFGLDATGLYVEVYRGGATREKTYQADWNIDKLDGTGQSDVNISATSGAIYQIEFTWYGNGEILFGVVRQTQDASGRRKQRFIPCHQYVPDDGEVSINTPNLRNFCRIDNGTTGVDYEARVGGMQYSIVGAFTPKPRSSFERRGSVSTSTTVIPLISARRRTGFGDRSIKLRKAQIIAGNSPHVLELRVGGTLSGPTDFQIATNHVASETALEYDTASTGITGGIPIGGSLVPANNPASQTAGTELNELDVPNGDIVTLCVRTVTSTSTIVAALLEMREEW